MRLNYGETNQTKIGLRVFEHYFYKYQQIFTVNDETLVQYIKSSKRLKNNIYP